MKKILLSASIFLALNAHAEMKHVTCDFSQEEGLKFRFLEIEPQTRFNNREKGSVYPYWVDDRFNPVNIHEKDYSFRQAKLSTNYFYARTESNGNGKDDSLVRYYKAVTENCNIVWARINQADPYFKEFFNQENHLMNGDIDWKISEDVLGIQLNDEVLKLKSRIGEKFTVTPYKTGESFKGKTPSQEKEVELKNYEKLLLVDVYQSMYVYQGVKKGSTTLRMKRENGDTVIVPWDPERISYKSPLQNKNIRSKYYQSIKDGNIHFGMNTDEVEASWGKPELLRYLPLYGGSGIDRDRFIKSDNYPYGQKFIKYKVERSDTRKPVGSYEEWYYSNKLPDKQTLVFDEDNILKEGNQTRKLQKHTIYNPVPLPEIK